MLRRLLLAVLVLIAAALPAQAALEGGDIICETTATTGTGTVNLAGAVANYATFVSQITSGATVPYHITSGDGKLETGIGTLTDATPDTLSRTADWSTDGVGAELSLSGTSTVCLGPITSLFSVGGNFNLYTDAGANSFWGWDDAAGVYENLTNAEAEAIMEPLIDTLANLTSIQGLTVTLADAGADAILGWDDSQSAYENLTALEAGALLFGADPGADRILFWDDSGGVYTYLTVAAPLTITTTTIDCAASTEGADGCIELATTGEVDIGTDTARAVTAAGVLAAVAGTQTIYIDGSGMTPRVTNGCAFPSTARETNSMTFWPPQCDQTTDEAVQFKASMPKNWNEGTITFKVWWTASAGTGTVDWELRCGSFANAAAINVTGLGTAVAVNDTLLATNDVHETSVSSAVTCSNAAANTVTWFELLRDVSDDTLTGDAEILGVNIFYTTDDENDD
jgi:hypothetical protein